MLHTFAANVDDKLGVPARVASLLRALDVSIETANDGQLAFCGLKARATLAWGNAPGLRPALGYDRAGLQPAAPSGHIRWDVAPC
jgi:hypothetical protein